MFSRGNPGNQEPGDGFSSTDPGNRIEAMTDATGLWRLAGWMSRSCTAMRAELKSVDCGSLDVLLYCPDDLAASTPGRAGAEVFSEA